MCWNILYLVKMHKCLYLNYYVWLLYINSLHRSLLKLYSFFGTSIKNSVVCLFFGPNLFFFSWITQLSQKKCWADDYKIWILPQELQSVDINLQSFWSNWCSAEEECNTSCYDVPCILFSTVTGHACHSPLQGCVGTILWLCAVTLLRLNKRRLNMSDKKLISTKICLTTQ